MNRIFALLLTMALQSNLQSQITHRVLENYEKYKEESIFDRRFKHEDIKKLIEKRLDGKYFDVKEEGKSIEGREIYSLKIGNGDIPILLWSQMHGDEATATMALMDLFNFFEAKDEFDDLRKTILDNTTIYFIPMLNPDGVDKFQRRNAIGVDLNRDALRLQSPEARILKGKRDETNAAFGFNLHDQGRVYSAGKSDQQATISWLAPAYNYEKETDEGRVASMKLIALLDRELKQYLGGKTAKYSDDFEPRAFGDNIQKWGTSLILIESGGYPDDRDKQYIRKMNFFSILRSFEAIADGSYKNENIADYEKIPFNDRLFFDLLLRNVTVIQDDTSYKLDLAIDMEEIDYNDYRNYRLSGGIEDLGDLHIFHGYEELDATGLSAVPGKVYPDRLTMTQLTSLNIIELFKEGYLFVSTGEDIQMSSRYPINILCGAATPPAQQFKLGNKANFILKRGEEVIGVVINGFYVPLTDIDSIDFYGDVIR